MNFTKKMSVLNKYRNELFGISIIGILLVHAKNEMYPFSNLMIRKLLGYGGIGVDIFLFLSGVGLYFSLRKDYNIKRFYRKRIARVVIPYLLIGGMFYFWKYFVIDFNPVGFFYELSLLSFWFDHKGAWFVAFIIPLYVLFPILYQAMKKASTRKTRTALLIATSLCATLVINLTLPSLYNHLLNVLVGIPVFILGCYYGEAVYEQKAIPFKLLLILLFLLPLRSFLNLNNDNILIGLSYSLFSIPFCILIAMTLDAIPLKSFNKFLRFVGKMSLEMYLFNIFLIQIFSYYNQKETFSWFSHQHCWVINYFLIILTGTILSYLFHETNKCLT